MSSLYLWQGFEKRKNSTKQPLDGSKITKTGVYLKEGTSLEQPVFVLSSNDFTYNYAQYNGTYYYIDDIVSIKNNLIELHCSRDLLATYKAKIQAASAFVLYYTHSNNEISDKRLSCKTSMTLSSETETFHELGTGQSYMITVVGETNTEIFACDKNKVDNLFDQQLTDDFDNDWNTATGDMIDIVSDPSITQVVDAIVSFGVAMFSWQDRLKGITNSALYASDAAEFVKNCYVLPIDKSRIGGTYKSEIMLGKWKSNAGGNSGFARMVYDSATVAIPWQVPSGRPDWLKNAPYHHMYLYIPYIGLVELSPSEITNATSLTVNVAIDVYSGVSTFVVNAGNGAVLGHYSTNIAAPYAIGSSNISIMSAGAQIVASAASIAAGTATGNILEATGGALGIANALKPIDMSVSSNGGAAGMGLGNTVKLFSVFHDVTVDPHAQSAIAGEPYNGVMALSGVPAGGYVQTSGASVEVGGFGNDKDIINSYLNGGIYIE